MTVVVGAVLGGVATVATAVGSLIVSYRTGQKTHVETERIRQGLEHESMPNHGSSMRDSLDRIESNMSTLSVRVCEQGKALSRVEEMQQVEAGALRTLAESDRQIHEEIDQMRDDMGRRIEEVGRR